MKRLILCEGKHDVLLVKSFFEHEYPDTPIETFRAKEQEFSTVGSLIGMESDKIRWFDGSYHDFDVLLKSENGIENLRQVVPKIVRQLEGLHVEKRLVVDLDGGTLDEFLRDINERIRGTHNGYSFVQTERIYKNSHLIAVKTELRKRGSPVDNYNLVAFHDNFEDSAGIDKKSDDDDTKQAKTRQFLADNKSVRHTLSESL
jgi:hypothetical protein